ncbi:MAG: HNH endonuclease [Candidatus Thorarchaeota archaeon]
MNKDIHLENMISDFKNIRQEFLSLDLDKRREYRFPDRFKGITKLLSKEHLQKLSMTEAENIYLNLRTGDRGSRARNLYHFLKNDITKIRESFIYLLYGADEPHKRFTEVIRGEKKLHGVKEDLISTLLHFLEPYRFGIWNKAARDGLKDIGRTPRGVLGESDGRKYERFNECVRAISTKYEFPELDVIDWFIAMISHNELDLKYKRKSRPMISDNRPKAVPPMKEGPPQRSISQSSTINRNGKVTRRVKDAESSTCQVCGEPIVLPGGERYYCEVHHIQPLGSEHGGDDHDTNAICLCPNHHAEMHCGLFFIEPGTREIIYYDSKHKYHGLFLRENQNPEASYFHKIDEETLKYHRDIICSWTTSMVVEDL